MTIAAGGPLTISTFTEVLNQQYALGCVARLLNLGLLINNELCVKILSKPRYFFSAPRFFLLLRDQNLKSDLISFFYYTNFDDLPANEEIKAFGGLMSDKWCLLQAFKTNKVCQKATFNQVMTCARFIWRWTADKIKSTLKEKGILTFVEDYQKKAKLRIDRTEGDMNQLRGNLD